MMKRALFLTSVLLSVALTACSTADQIWLESDISARLTGYGYAFLGAVEVNGRQGVAYDGGYYFVSDSARLIKYDADWNVILENTDPFAEGYSLEVNHIGDIDVYQNEIYCGVEQFADGKASNIQISVYDADTLKFKHTFPFEPESGLTEISGITVDPDERKVWMCSWADGASGRYLYQYDLDTGAYCGKVYILGEIQRIQGIAYYNGDVYISADDGNANRGEPDHIYRTRIPKDAAECTFTPELTLDHVINWGETEGLTFDTAQKQLLVLHNRNVENTEIHEIYQFGF